MSNIHLQNEAGFTLIETAISMVLLAIIGLGVASLFAYAATNTVNAGDRDMASAVAQQRMEQLRSLAFTDSALNATIASGAVENVIRLGRTFSITTIIVDSSIVDSKVRLKTITVKVTPQSSSASWSTQVTSNFGSVTLVNKRSAQLIGPNRSL